MNQQADDSKFPNPMDGEGPDFDSLMDDLKREEREKAGKEPLPYQTWAFWISLFSTVLAYVLFSGVLSTHGFGALEHGISTIIVILGHFGYAEVARFLKKRKGSPGKYAAGKPSFWASLAAVLTSYALGSGLPAEHEVVGVATVAATVLGYFGYTTRAWIRQRQMVSPLDKPRVLSRLLSLLLGFQDSNKGGLRQDREEKKDNPNKEDF